MDSTKKFKNKILTNYELSRKEFEKHNFEESLKYINLALNQNESESNFLFLKGLILDSTGKYEQAVIYYRRAIDIDPNDSVFYENLGKCLKDLQRYQEALDEFKKAIKLDSENAMLYYEIGELFDKLKNPGEAKIFFHMGIDKDYQYAFNFKLEEKYLTEIDEFQEKLVKFEENSIYHDVNASKIIKDEENNFEINEKIESLNLDNMKFLAKIENELKKNPNDPNGNYQKGNLLKKSSRYLEAIPSFEKCLDINRKDKHSIIKLADCFLNIRNYNKAIELCEKFINFESGNYKPYKIKSICLYELGSYENALLSIVKAIKIQPDNMNSYKLKSKIEHKLENLR